MVRGLVYSIISVSVFLLASIAWMTIRPIEEDAMVSLTGWLLLISFFGVGPLFFVLGYWHHLRRHPKEPHWDAELGE